MWTDGITSGPSLTSFFFLQEISLGCINDDGWIQNGVLSDPCFILYIVWFSVGGDSSYQHICRPVYVDICVPTRPRAVIFANIII